MQRILILGLFLLSGILLKAQAPEILPSGDAKQKYYLIFSARPPSLKPFSIGGHAFVSWGIEKDSTVSIDKTYGFYPKKGVNLIEAVAEIHPGRVVDGYKRNSNGQRVKQLVVRVDYKLWQKTLSQAESWQGSRYNLLYNNCTDFMDNIADQATLCTPRTNNFLGLPRNPDNFIKRMWRRNKHCAVPLHNLRIDKEGTKD